MDIDFLSRNRFKSLKIFISFFAGLLFAISLYAAITVSRDVFRIFPVFWQHEYIELSHEALHFYNLFFAFVSVIFGQSVFFAMLWDRPKKFKKTNRRFKKSIVNDQRNLNWYTLYWLVKIGFVFGVGIVPMFHSFEFTFSLYPDYRFMLWAIVLMLFLNSWISIRRVYKRNSLKWMGISAFIITLVSFSLAQVQIFDVEKFRFLLPAYKVDPQVKLELPISNFYSKTDKYYLTHEIHVAQDERGKETGLILYLDNREVSFENLEIELSRIIDDHPNRNWIRPSVHFFIHRTVEMKSVLHMVDLVRSKGFGKVYFRVSSHDFQDWPPYHSHFYLMPGIPSHSEIPPPDFLENKERIVVNPRGEGYYEVSGKNLDTHGFVALLIEEAMKNPVINIQLYVPEKMAFLEYISVIDDFQLAIQTLQDIKSIEKFGVPFLELSQEEKQEILLGVSFSWREILVE